MSTIKADVYGDSSGANEIDFEYIINGGLTGYGQCDDAGTSYGAGFLNVSSVTDYGANNPTKGFNFTNDYNSVPHGLIGWVFISEWNGADNLLYSNSLNADLIAVSIYNSAAWIDTYAAFQSTGLLA